MKSGNMTIGGLTCRLHMPPALTSRYDAKGNKIDNSLPPYNLRAAYSVDDYPASPEEWPRGTPDTGSYFVGVKDGSGLWLDFNENLRHTHDVAIVVSVQGVNAITGDKVTPDTLRLEQYRTTCPKHGTLLGAERLCTTCNYKLPPQNYLSTAGTPYGSLWLDGWRIPDGTVRQFVVTTETARGVASQLIGSERTFRLSVAYYLSKAPKPVQASPRRRTLGGYDDSTLEAFGGSDFLGGTSKSISRGAIRTTSVNSRRMEIAAGERITQNVYQDPNDVSYWQERPAATLFINYTDEESAEAIIRAGAREQNRDGFLSGARVGHDPDPFSA